MKELHCGDHSEALRGSVTDRGTVNGSCVQLHLRRQGAAPPNDITQTMCASDVTS